MTIDHPSCPQCGSDNIAKILYGFVCIDDDLERELDAGRITLGGCCITGDDPQWSCNECLHRWCADAPFRL